MDKELEEKRKRRSRVRRIKNAIMTFLVLWVILMTAAVCVLSYCVYSLYKKAPSEAVASETETTEEEDPSVYSDVYAYNDDALAIYEKEATDNLASPGDQEAMEVYLTFDDGPSGNSDEILDILDDYGVKATFFVNGRTDDHSLSVYKRIVDEGHTIAMHSYTHKYSEVYANLENFSSDYKRIRDLIYDTTGVKPVFYRFPGGSSNQVSKTDMKVFIDYLDKEGITYFDWNVMSGDATTSPYTSDDLIENVISNVVKYKSSVVLMHDADNKKATVEALPQIIDQLRQMGARILPITEETTVVQHIH